MAGRHHKFHRQAERQVGVVMTENAGHIDRDDHEIAPNRQVLAGGKPKRSYQNRKIQRAVDDEIADGGSMETLELLTPAERRRRLNGRLSKLGVGDKELPTPRTYQRYFNGR